MLHTKRQIVMWKKVKSIGSSKRMHVFLRPTVRKVWARNTPNITWFKRRKKKCNLWSRIWYHTIHVYIVHYYIKWTNVLVEYWKLKAKNMTHFTIKCQVIVYIDLVGGMLVWWIFLFISLKFGLFQIRLLMLFLS